MNRAEPYPHALLEDYSPQRTFENEALLQIAMPLGGIGAGCICLNGQGGIQDFSIRHHPAITGMQDGHVAADAAFALLHLPQQGTTRLVEGPMPPPRIYNQGLKSQGYRGGGHEGLPRFRQATFQGEYPFGRVSLADADLPLRVQITGWNPFIPLDDVNSGLPCAILEYTLENHTGQPVPFEFSFHLSHLASGSQPGRAVTSRNAIIPGAGVYLYNEEDPNAETYGSAALAVIGHEPVIKAMWFRGGWFDAISALWREVTTGTFHPNDGSNPANLEGRNGGSILLTGTLAPGESVTYPIVIAWHFPNVHYTAGQPEPDVIPLVCDGPDCCGDDETQPAWRPFYVSQWQNAREVVGHLLDHYPALRQRTQAFHDALFSSTLPQYVLDAVSANLAIIKSPTVLRQESGNVWAWEGCFPDRGCCHGSCTHVWNYAQAIPHLFPQLERTLREQELRRSMDDRGHVAFRSALPDGPAKHTFHAAADGQLGGIMKVYREWQIAGDRDWLQEMYPLAKRSMDYCIAAWDPNHKGVVEEPHHNTYDIEFWGPDGMCTSFYLGALAAMAALARESDHAGDAPFYEELAQKGVRYLDEHLFNGEYYEQAVTVEGLRDTSFAEAMAKVGEDAPIEQQLLKQEGPKYQYGTGCLSDGVLGVWMANVCGLEHPLTPAHVQENLDAIFAYNFRTSLWEHANAQRPGYALGDEPGLLLCTWPRGGKPTLPFPYSDEVWTGIEYQVASHLIQEGRVAEGLTIVRAVRARHDGWVRNPWNEYECGNYYARAMASYALLNALSGFRYSAPEKTLYFGPQLAQDNFRIFFATAGGWGTLTLGDNNLTIHLAEGELEVGRLVLRRHGETTTLEPRVTIRSGEPLAIDLPA